MNLTIELPDDLAQKLEAAAAARHISIEQLAIERLTVTSEDRPGSPGAVLRALRQPPHLKQSDVDALEAAIAAARRAAADGDVFDSSSQR